MAEKWTDFNFPSMSRLFSDRYHYMDNIYNEEEPIVFNSAYLVL